MLYGASFYYNGIRYNDLLSYQLRSSFGTHGILKNPILKFDYSLSEDSIALGSGIDVDIPFNGNNSITGACGCDGDEQGCLTRPFISSEPVIRILSIRNTRQLL